MAAALPLRQARMEFKTNNDTKELLSQAAAADGMDLTSFVLGSAVEKARKVLQDHSLIKLTYEGQQALAELLQKPATPTDAMHELMRVESLPFTRT